MPNTVRRLAGGLLGLAVAAILTSVILVGLAGRTPASVSAGASATSTTATALATASPSAAPHVDGVPIIASKNARGVATNRLVEVTGSKCFTWMMATLLPLPGDLDTRVSAAGGSGHWLKEGAWPYEGTWIGDAQSAVAAYGATWAVQDAGVVDVLWIQTAKGDKTLIVGLRATTSPGAALVWRAYEIGNAAPCSSDGE